MRFNPADNLFGAPLWTWLVVGVIWFGLIWLFDGPPEWFADWRARRRARNDPPTGADGP